MPIAATTPIPTIASNALFRFRPAVSMSSSRDGSRVVCVDDDDDVDDIMM